MRNFIIFFALTFLCHSSFAQNREITTAVPFVLVAADARAAGMADNGVATSPDMFSQQWNPAKYVFMETNQGISTSYTPYLTGLANDVSLAQVTYFKKIKERSAFGVSIRYFGFGDIELRKTGQADETFQIVSPNEFAIDGSYTLKLSEKFSMAVGGRFVNSNLKVASEGTDASSASTFAIDVAGYFVSEEKAYAAFNGIWRAGFNLQNLGPKIKYDNNDAFGNFMPANLKFGGGFDFILNDQNKVSTSLELNKLLVPTPKFDTDRNGDGLVNSDDTAIASKEYNDIGWVSGIFSSFGDAPDGFSEELKEMTYSLGAEYLYKDSFALRLGYFNQSPTKGANKFFSMGAGFKYNAIKIDMSYLFSASKVKNPLENTLRFSLSFNLGDKEAAY